MLCIDRQLCNGCGHRTLARCEDICPGNLPMRDTEHKAVLRDAAACWDCFACVKRCPRNALSIVLPFAISTSQMRMRARKYKDKLVWEILDMEGAVIQQLGEAEDPPTGLDVSVT